MARSESITNRTQCPFLDYKAGYCNLEQIGCSKDFKNNIPPFCPLVRGRVSIQLSDRLSEIERG
jgi:hypothetical protein